MELADGVSLLDAARAAAASWSPSPPSGGPVPRALAWLESLILEQPSRQQEVSQALLALGLGEDPREHDALVDFAAHAATAHWFWPQLTRVLEREPHMVSRTQGHWQPDAPPLRLDSLAPGLEARFEALGRRDASLWTAAPTPAMKLARYRDELAEAVATTVDWGAAADLSFLRDAAVDCTWVWAELPWLTRRFPFLNDHPALAPWRAGCARGPYRRQAPRDEDRGRVTLGRFTFRGMNDLASAIRASLEAARSAGAPGVRPLGWVDRLLAARPAWRPLVDAALAWTAQTQPRDASGLVDWALTGGLVQHTPRAMDHLMAVAPDDRESLTEAGQSAAHWSATPLSWPAGAGNPGPHQDSRTITLGTSEDLHAAVEGSLQDDHPPPSVSPGHSGPLGWLLPLLTHASSVTSRDLVDTLGAAIARRIDDGSGLSAQAAVALAVACPDKAALLPLWEDALTRQPPWFALPSTIPALPVSLGELVAELVDQGRLQRAQAPRWISDGAQGPPLDAALCFIQALIQAEFQARCAAYDEPDSARFDAIVAQATACYDPLLRGPSNSLHQFARPPTAALFGDDPFAAQMLSMMGATASDHAAGRAALRPAAVFRVVHHRHPLDGDRFCFDLEAAQGHHTIRMFGRRLVAWLGVDGMAVHALHHTCRACGTLDATAALPCEQCSGSGWSHADGERVDDLGPVLAVVRLERPTHPPHAASWER